jgi:hypothetical protein
MALEVSNGCVADGVSSIPSHIKSFFRFQNLIEITCTFLSIFFLDFESVSVPKSSINPFTNKFLNGPFLVLFQ